MGGDRVADQQLFTAYGLRVRGAWLIRSVMFGGGAQLRDAQVDGQMNMEGASVADKQPFDADRLHIGPGGLFLHNVRFGGPVSFHSAQIDGQMDMGGSSVADKQTFDAAALHVGADGLFLRKVQFGGPVKLLDAQAGQMDMEGASVADQQAFDAGRMHVGAGGLFMKNARFGGAVNLREARIDGTFTLEGTEIAKDQTFAAAGLYVGAAGLDLSSVKFGGPVELRNARVDGRMFMLDANIASDQSFDAEALHVGRDLFLRGTTFGGPVSFLAMSIDGGLDLRNTHLHQMNMGGAVVGTDFVLGGVYGEVEQWTHWDSCDGPTPCLNVRNVKAGNLQDDERAWPPHITLEGFTYSHLGGIGGEQRQDMRNRSIELWRDWLDRDPVYSAQPYMQLASVLATAGNRDGAEEIRFFGRDRERSELLRGCE